jgi:hypothetical protein
MHVTKDDWALFLKQLSTMIGQEFHEFHTRKFYSGSGMWKNIRGDQRSDIMKLFVDWFSERKHHVVFSVIDKQKHEVLRKNPTFPSELNTVWKTMAFHISLALQKHFQNEPKNKGNTIMIFDEEVTEELDFQKLILNPPTWSDEYYEKGRKQERLNQIVDAPYFADSKNIALIQTADFLAYIVRRYVEIKEGEVPPKFSDEEAKITAWFEKIKARSLSYQCMYPKRQRCASAEMFWNLAPKCVQEA